MEGESSFLRFKRWINEQHNFTFMLILLLGIVLRIYYFAVTKDQPIWWDEADYLAYAKNLAGMNSDWIITQQHNSIYPYIVAGLFKLGLGEVGAKFIVQTIPSILIIVLAFLTLSAMYKEKKIALVGSFFIAVFWEFLFNSMRFHVDVLGLFFGLLAIYVFWDGYENKNKIFGFINSRWAIPSAVIFAILAYGVRRGHFLFGAFILVYMLLTKDFKGLIKDKSNWIGLGIALVLLLIAEGFVFSSGISGVAESYTHTENEIGLLMVKGILSVFKAYFANPNSILFSSMFYLFILGIVLILINIGFSVGYIKNEENKETRADLFAIISIILTLALFIFVLRVQIGYGEARWYFPLLLASSGALARGSVWLYGKIRQYNKIAALVVVGLLLIYGGYNQYQQADSAIKGKISSFEGIRSAGLYMKQNSGENEVIISQPVPQTIYYAERKVVQPEQVVGVTGNGYTSEEFIEALKKNTETKYLLISFSEPGYPEWMRKYGYINNQGQMQLASWEIPFMDSKVDFINQKQDIKQSKSFNGLTLTLIDVKGDVFIYEILRNYSDGI
ncbi:MAG: glycosyltransferase family 39 protein [Nanoarchaeota archaeon]